MSAQVRCGVCGVFIARYPEAGLPNPVACSSGHTLNVIYSKDDGINVNNHESPQSVQIELPPITQTVATVTNSVGTVLETIIKLLGG